MSGGSVPLYWPCAGEVMTRAGAGVQPLTPSRALELQAFYRREARGQASEAARRHCLACASQLGDALVKSRDWRQAAIVL